MPPIVDDGIDYFLCQISFFKASKKICNRRFQPALFMKLKIPEKVSTAGPIINR